MQVIVAYFPLANFKRVQNICIFIYIKEIYFQHWRIQWMLRRPNWTGGKHQLEVVIINARALPVYGVLCAQCNCQPKTRNVAWMQLYTTVAFEANSGKSGCDPIYSDLSVIHTTRVMAKCVRKHQHLNTKHTHSHKYTL